MECFIKIAQISGLQMTISFTILINMINNQKKSLLRLKPTNLQKKLNPTETFGLEIFEVNIAYD